MGPPTAPDPRFADVDRSADPRSLVDYLDARAASDFFQVVERRLVARLAPLDGGHFLDVGCGAGDDVRALAELVGPAGRVVGLDSSATMIEEARRRAAGTALPVAFHVGDAHRLAFPDASFDGCRTERVLQHLADPAGALAELARVARPGGRVACWEPDWETLIVSPGERAVTRAVLRQRCDTTRSGWVGRALPGLFRRAGLAAIEVEPFTAMHFDVAGAEAGLQLRRNAERAVAAGEITEADAAAWLGALQAADAAGEFFAAVTGFLVSGRKP